MAEVGLWAAHRWYRADTYRIRISIPSDKLKTCKRLIRGLWTLNVELGSILLLKLTWDENLGHRTSVVTAALTSSEATQRLVNETSSGLSFVCPWTDLQAC
jgi:hypothetical protein